MGQVIIFDVWSRFAYFRRHYTTTTASSHPLIPRSAIEGLIGAICGYNSENYPELLGDAKITVSIDGQTNFGSKKFAKSPFGIAYTHSDFWSQQVGKYLRRGGGGLNHVPVPRSIEILQEPSYRIYFSTDRDEVFQELIGNLRHHTTHYTPYLGTSNMIANFRFVDLCEFSTKRTTEDEEVRIQSIVPFFGKMPRIKAESDSQYAIEQNIPLHIDALRRPAAYYSAVYSPIFGQTIIASGLTYSHLSSRDKEVNIVFIPISASSS